MARPHALNAVQRSDVVRRYRGGESIRQLMAVYGAAYGTIHRTLTAAGVTFRPRGGTR